MALEKRSFTLAGHRTSVALEAEFWGALERIASARGVRLVALLAERDAAREAGTALASALRVFALRQAALPRTADEDRAMNPVR